MSQTRPYVSERSPSRLLSTLNLQRALRLWSAGKDTYDIGLALELPEYVIFNALREWRERARFS